ncbi:hypothetical protein QBC42DRAFT_236897 [Cladorrhinum samala]|uniref:Uncharacterized protein n=1 Tax=Cladorrhinum samala TaxID=585594 RepID=A0AAV9HAW4_9PEZI|nr:hypothetical protein QBC42DRAFT_236897 [Cladorrhinum samala]
MTWVAMEFLAYLYRVGGLSLPSLFLGGVVLIFFATNTLSGDHDDRTQYQNYTPEPDHSQSSAVPLRVGSHLPVQFWLAVLGAAFGLLSYGLSGAYIHVFDWWCARQAQPSGPGLDYSLYLNSQPRAPGFGFKGFKLFAVLKNTLTVLEIAGSVGYKFAVVQVTGEGGFHVPESTVVLHVPKADAFLTDGSASPWLGDMNPRWGNINRMFRSQDLRGEAGVGPIANGNIPQPPRMIVMTSQGDCGNTTFDIRDQGFIDTLEVVLVATQTTSRPSSESISAIDAERWARVERAQSGWFDGSSRGVVVDYQIDSFNFLHVRWTEAPDRNTNSTAGLQEQRATKQIMYSMALSFAVVRRKVVSGGCSQLLTTDLIVEGIAALNAERKILSSDFILPNKHWIAAVIQESNTTPLEGIGVIVRNAMVALLPEITLASNHSLGHQPSLLENGTMSVRWWKPPRQWASDYPYYYGTKVSYQIGSYDGAAVTFMIIGISACCIAIARLFLGPVALTSWTGQHVYLALEGKVQRGGAEKLACGRQPADGMGYLRLEPKVEPRWHRLFLAAPSCSSYSSGFEWYVGRWVNGL